MHDWYRLQSASGNWANWNREPAKSSFCKGRRRSEVTPKVTSGHHPLPRDTSHLPSGQHQALHGLRRLENLQLLNQMDASAQVQCLVHPAITCRSQWAVRAIPTLGTFPWWLPLSPARTCADEEHLVDGTVQPSHSVHHELGEVGVLLEQQRAAAVWQDGLIHQRVFLGKVEGVVGQLEGAGEAILAVPVRDALWDRGHRH